MIRLDDKSMLTNEFSTSQFCANEKPQSLCSGCGVVVVYVLYGVQILFGPTTCFQILKGYTNENPQSLYSGGRAGGVCTVRGTDSFWSNNMFLDF